MRIIRHNKNQNKNKKEQALGYVESLIAIAISGILLVAVALLASRVSRTTVKNEIQDEATQLTIMYVDVIKAIEDNGWSTEDGKIPQLSHYDICYADDTGVYSLCDPSNPDSEVFEVGSEDFSREITVNTVGDLALVNVTVNCDTGLCSNISHSQPTILTIKGDDVKTNDGLGAGTNEPPAPSTPGVSNNTNTRCGNGVIETSAGETCDNAGRATEVCPISSCKWQCPYGSTYKTASQLSGNVQVSGTYAGNIGSVNPENCVWSLKNTSWGNNVYLWIANSNLFRVSSNNPITTVESNLATYQQQINYLKSTGYYFVATP